MTLPPQDSQHYELRRRIVDCRERLRRKRGARKSVERAAHAEPSELPKIDAQKEEAAA